MLENYSKTENVFEEDIIKLGNDWFEQLDLNEDAESLSTEVEKMKAKLGRMEQAGLKMTKNFLTLRDQITKMESKASWQSISKNSYDVASQYQTRLMEHQIGIAFVREGEFAQLLQKKNMSVESINHWCGELTDAEINACMVLSEEAPFGLDAELRLNEKLFRLEEDKSIVLSDVYSVEGMLYHGNLIDTPLFPKPDVSTFVSKVQVEPIGGHHLLIAYYHGTMDSPYHMLFHRTACGIVVYLPGSQGVNYLA